MTASPTEPRLVRAGGFSLLELSIVLIVVGLLAGGLLGGVSAQRANAARQQTERQLDVAREALLAFAIANGRLPCPAAAALPESDPAAGRENCAREHGVLPWVSLGLPQNDPWGRRLSYFASAKFTALPTAGALAGFTMSSGLAPDNTGLADVRSSSANGSRTQAIELAAVVVSHAAQGSGAYRPDGGQIAGASGDQAENADQDLIFVADLPTASFDDQLSWISPHLLKARLIAAGKLP